MDASLDLLRRALAEGLAAFALVTAGCGAIVADARYDGALGAVGVALAFGLIITAMIYATGHLSGAHSNPAVTLAFCLTRHFAARDASAYIAAQLTGATVGALVLLAIWPEQPADLGATAPTVGSGSALVYEVLLTAILMFVIMAVATDTRAVGAGAAIAIGGDHRPRRPVRRSRHRSVENPARSLGPAPVAGEWRDLWVYVLGPVLGAALGALAYQLVRGRPVPPPVSADALDVPSAATVRDGGRGADSPPLMVGVRSDAGIAAADAYELAIGITGELRSGRLLGAENVGHHTAQVAKRIDVFATALHEDLTVDALSDLDLSYTPLLGAPWDPVQAAAQTWTAQARRAELLKAA